MTEPLMIDILRDMLTIIGLAIAPMAAFGFLLPKWLACFKRFSWLRATPKRRFLLPVELAILFGVAGLALSSLLERYGNPELLRVVGLCWCILALIDVLLIIGWSRHLARASVQRAEAIVEVTKQKGRETKSAVREFLAQQNIRQVSSEDAPSAPPDEPSM